VSYLNPFVPEDDAEYSWGVSREQWNLDPDPLELPETNDLSDDAVWDEYVELEEEYEFDESLSLPHGFVTKDSGVRSVRPSGYQRDTQQGKPRFDLLLPQGVPYSDQFLTRWANLLARGADKYSERNWEQASDQEDLDRFQSSAFRHLMQWMSGELDEDHAAAVAYNLMAYETTKYKMTKGGN